MSQILPEDILDATGMSEEELRQEIAVLLFQKEKLTLARASRLAGMTRLPFQHLIASREIARLACPAFWAVNTSCPSLRSSSTTSKGKFSSAYKDANV